MNKLTLLCVYLRGYLLAFCLGCGPGLRCLSHFLHWLRTGLMLPGFAAVWLIEYSWGRG